MARWWYDIDIPLNATNSLYYQPIIDAIVFFGLGFKSIGFHDVKGPLL